MRSPRDSALRRAVSTQPFTNPATLTGRDSRSSLPASIRESFKQVVGEARQPPRVLAD